MLDELWRWGWLVAIGLNGVTTLAVWGMRANFVSRRELADQLERRDQARDRELAELYGKLNDLDVRQSRTEERIATVPTITAVHTMEVRLEQIAGDLKSMSTGLEAMRGDVSDFKSSVVRIQQHLMRTDGGGNS